MALLRTRNRGRSRTREERHPPARSAREERARRAASQPPIVELEDASVVYPGGHLGLDRVSLQVERGEFMFLVGPTGCGKSTFIKLLIREVELASGGLWIAGRDITSLPEDRTPYLRRRIGTVFQDFKLLPNRTVFDNVAYALQVTGGTRSDIRRKVPEILRLVGLADKTRSYPDELSGGEQQRVSVARAFVNHPPLLLADEPTGNLDPETSIGIMQLLYRINRTGTTVLVATHDREMVDKMRRRVVALHEGRVVRDQAAGMYADDESTTEFAVRMKAEMGIGDEGHTNGESH
jgi:cell division transport system ATP-binding protein